jgi:two-component system, OmpR family, sensor histidine kinase CiaH
MAGHRPRDVRRRSIRVALAAAAIVAVLYVAVAGAVMVIVTGNLTLQVDERLRASLAEAAATGGLGDDGTRKSDENRATDDDRQFGPPILFWKIAPGGAATYVGPSNYAVDLPTSYAAISAPQTVVVNGARLRMAGRQIGSSYYVTAQSLTSVSDAQATLVLTEVLIAPFLLVVVFSGAVIIGRRVAAPIELARRRQLEFTADASHELRTPLSVIEANASLALTQDRTTDWYRTAFEHVEDEALRMRKLLDDLLWLARFDATQVPSDKEPVDLGLLAGAAAERFGAVAEARHQSLEVRPASDGLIVTASAEWLDRLVGVLLDNACKYSPDGGSVVMAVAPDRGRVVLTVDDSGPGIPEAERSRVFDRFHRATDARSGAGLGLAIGDAIVRATGGQWRIGTSPSGGARLSVSWPRSIQRSNEAMEGSSSQMSLPHDAATPS